MTTATEKQAITANIRRIGMNEPGEFQTLHINLPLGVHWGTNHGSHGNGEFTLYSPMDADLKAIVLACEGELDRRQEARAAADSNPHCAFDEMCDEVVLGGQIDCPPHVAERKRVTA